MGQAEVFDFLKDNQKSWFTAKEITDNTGFSAGSVSVALKGLRKSDMVEYKIIKTVGYKGAKRGTYCYRYKGETQTKLMGYFAKV